MMSNSDDREEVTMKMRREVPIREPKDKPWMAMLLTFFAFGLAIGGIAVRAYDESEVDRAQVKVDRAENAVYAQRKLLCDPTSVWEYGNSISLTTQGQLTTQGELVGGLVVDSPPKLEGSDSAGRFTFTKPWTKPPTCVLNASTTELDYVCGGERSK